MRVVAFVICSVFLAVASLSCSGGAKCTAANCMGCCDSVTGTCTAGTAQNACGKGGATCAPCAAGTSCGNGVCSAGTGGGSGSTGGGSGSNAGGTGGTAGGTGGTAGGTGGTAGGTGGTAGGTGGTAGGTGGTAGGTGGTAGGTGGTAGGTGGTAGGTGGTAGGTGGTAGGTGGTAGGSGGVGAVGAGCTTTANCNNFGTGSTCKTTSDFGGVAYPGGYCTKDPCDNATNTCPAGSTCAYIGFDKGEAQPICLATCTTAGQQSNCRTGYSCYNLGAANGCYLAPIPNVPPTTTATQVGNPCTMDSQCQNPPNAPYNELGFCVTATLPDGGPSRFPSGYCFADCFDLDQPFCGTASRCVGFRNAQMVVDQAYCLLACPTPGQQSICRTGYTCTAIGDGGVCYPP